MPKPFPERLPRPNEVGTTIRRFRERVGLSTRELARRLGVASSYISKVELGQLSPQPELCERVGRALALPRAERDLLRALRALHRAEHHPVTSGAESLRQAQQAVRRLEQACRTYRSFQLSLIPGLLQTREYVSAIFSRFTSPSRRSASVAERLARQKILKDPQRSFRFLILDWALSSHWCSGRVMAAQLRHLRALSAYPNIDIRVLRREVRFPKEVPPLVSGFEVLDEAIVIVDTLSGLTTFRQSEEIAVYLQTFGKIIQLGEHLSGTSPRS